MNGFLVRSLSDVGSSLAFLPASAVESSQQDVVSQGPISITMDGISDLHDLAGLPWWASLALTGIGESCIPLPKHVKEQPPNNPKTPTVQDHPCDAKCIPRACNSC